MGSGASAANDSQAGYYADSAYEAAPAEWTTEPDRVMVDREMSGNCTKVNMPASCKAHDNAYEGGYSKCQDIQTIATDCDLLLVLDPVPYEWLGFLSKLIPIVVFLLETFFLLSFTELITLFFLGLKIIAECGINFIHPLSTEFFHLYC